MKIKTSELTGIALDWAVAQCENKDTHIVPDNYYQEGCLVFKQYDHDNDCFILVQYSTNWSQGGPIIERELIRVIAPTVCGVYWVARIKQSLLSNMNGWFENSAPTPLIAAMRCFVASKLGDEVEIPNTLLI